MALILLTGAGAGGQRLFTVRDSIEMSVFTEPETRIGWGVDAPVKLSPDRKHFAVVTTRGLIRSNQSESTLWAFDVAHPVPKIIARLAAVTNDPEIISKVTWSSDSHSLYFLGQNSIGGTQLYSVNLSGVVHALTPSGMRVSQYAAANGTVLYTAARPDERFVRAFRGDAINADASAVTGLPATAILFRDLWLKSGMRDVSDLRSIRGTDAKVIDPSSNAPVEPIVQVGYTVLTISPNGRSAVIIRALKHWESQWNRYEPYIASARYRPSQTTLFDDWLSSPAEYALVNLQTGRTTSLLRAPLARIQGYADPTQAAWSSDGKRIILTATYLPIPTGVIQEKNFRPCAAAVVEVDSKAFTCLRPMSRSTEPSARFIGDASFDRTGTEVSFRVVNRQNDLMPYRIRYRKTGNRWGQIASIRAVANTASVFVHQDLNEPPALFAIDPATHRRTKIWDPNPQLTTVNLGEASVLDWTDSSGHRWIAGLLKPPNYVAGRRYPLVIQTHGFQAHQFLTDGGHTTALAARPLAGAGFVVLQMPVSFDHIVTRREASDQLLGYDSAIGLLTARGLIDPTKIGIIGFSRTCYHVEEALIKEPSKFAAATIADGVDESYLQYLIYGADGSQVPEQERIYGTKPFGKGLQVWSQAAPGFKLDKIRTPLRIEAISLPSILTEWEIYASLRLQHKPVDLILFPTGDHVLAKPLERIASQQGNVDWFRFWLQGYEDPDPAKAAQYVRWRQLRRLQAKVVERQP